VSAVINLARETALWAVLTCAAVAAATALLAALDYRRHRRRQRQAIVRPVRATGCPWCDDPDCIDREQCYRLARCPMQLCQAPDPKLEAEHKQLLAEERGRRG
jgi:hypothetical protein